MARQHDADEAAIRSASHESSTALQAQLKELDAARSHFATLFNESRHDELVRSGERTLSYAALQVHVHVGLLELLRSTLNVRFAGRLAHHFIRR